MSQRSHDYLRTPEAAEVLRVSPATLAKWRVLGTGPNYHKVGHVVLYSRADLTTWINTRRREPRRGE